MKFEENKVMTAITADRARPGMLGWFSNDLRSLITQINMPYSVKNKLVKIYDDDFTHRFVTDSGTFSFFYPAPITYFRPFRNFEEFKPYCDRIFKTKDSNLLTAKVNFYTEGGVYFNINIFISYNEIFDKWTFENGDPCGFKEVF